jgi:tRNA (cmo5U34)-methyltransferase
MPFAANDSFRVVELASGEGYLSHAILHRFTGASLLALDGSETMRQETGRRLAKFGARASVDAFDMQESSWHNRIEGADCVVSSLCIHHLDGAEKQQLFNAVSERLSPRGAFLIADLILPQRDEPRALFAAAWDRSAQAQSVQQTGSAALFDLFKRENWNYFRYPDPFDKPSPLFDQLLWLREAGLAVVDCFWMQAGHAIYGGYKSVSGASDTVTAAEAWESAKAVFDAGCAG